MPNNYNNATNQSWGSRLKNSLGGIIMGFILLIGAIILLWYNEGRTVKTTVGLNEGKSDIVYLTEHTPDSNNEGKLVYLSGYVDSQENLKDDEFGIETKALKLERIVEIYQWVEKSKSESKDKLGGGQETITTYSYDKKWKRKLINSDHFHISDGHINPKELLYTSRQVKSNKITLGEFILNDRMTGRMNNSSSYNLSSLDGLNLENANLVQETHGQENQTKIYLGLGSPNTPQVGDVKISFRATYPSNFTIIAKQEGNSFNEFKTSKGTSIMMIREGTHNSDAMFESAHSTNKLLSWGLRIGGFFLLFFAFKLIIRPLVILGKVVPFLGKILNLGSSIISGVLAAVISLVVIALSWVWYRPILAWSLLGLSLIIFLFYYIRGKKSEESEKQYS